MNNNKHWGDEMHDIERFGDDLSRLLQGVHRGRGIEPPEFGRERHPPGAPPAGESRFIFIRDPETDAGTILQWDPESDGEQLVMSTTRQAAEGFPFTTRLRIDRERVQHLEVIPLEEHGDQRTTYGIRHQPSGETAENIEFAAIPYGGPGRQNTTYFGTYNATEPAPEGEYEALYVGNPVIWVIILIGAAICAGIISVGAIVHDCASQCAETCGAANVEKCAADVTFGFGWEDGKLELGCHHECEVTCQ